MSQRGISVLALLAIVSGLVVAGKLDANSVEENHLKYCSEVVTWKVEALQGIPPEQRTGHPDYRDIAADYCPGMRPAP